MQTITVISGQTREGKTEELIGQFVNFCSAWTEIVNENKEVNKVKNMDLVKPYYLSCEESATSIYERVLAINPNIGDIGNIKEVDNINDIVSYIKDKIEEKDSIFFIDMPYTIAQDFHRTITRLQDAYPNDKCKHSFDVIYTRSRSLLWVNS